MQVLAKAKDLGQQYQKKKAEKKFFISNEGRTLPVA